MVGTAGYDVADPTTADAPRSGECVIWWASARPWRSLVGSLDDVEQGRIHRLRRPADQDRFATGAWLLRAAVAGATGVEPRALAVDRTCRRCDAAHGRPRIYGEGRRLRASVTHAGDHVGVAISWLGDPVQVEGYGRDGGDGLGLDVEGPAAAALLPTIEREVVGADEQRSLPDAATERAAELVRRWVAKEALLKAAGVGLGIAPVAVELERSGARLALRRWPVPVRASAAHLVELAPPAPGYTAALAMVGRVAPAVRQLLLPSA